jgi:hypothetical protein
MSYPPDTTIRISRRIVVMGAAAFIVHLVLRSDLIAGRDPVEVYRDGVWLAINVLGILGAMLVVLGLPVLAARLIGSIGTLGFVGGLMITAAWLFFGVFLSLYGALLAPWLAELAPALVAASAPVPAALIATFVGALLIETAGTICLALPFLRSDVEPRWIGFLLPIASLLTIGGDLLAPSGPAANLTINVLSNLGPMLLMVAVAGIGAWTLTGKPVG